MPDGRAARFVAILASVVVAVVLVRWPAPVVAAGSIPSPEQFIGFKTGTDNKLARWDRIVKYMKTVAAGWIGFRLRELAGQRQQPVRDARDRLTRDDQEPGSYKQFERKLYFQNGAPTARERDDTSGRAKSWCSSARHPRH